MRLSSSFGKAMRPNNSAISAGISRCFSLYPVDDLMFGLTEDQQQVGHSEFQLKRLDCTCAKQCYYVAKL